MSRKDRALQAADTKAAREQDAECLRQEAERAKLLARSESQGQ
jgi:hypothetical protein